MAVGRELYQEVWAEFEAQKKELFCGRRLSTWRGEAKAAIELALKLGQEPDVAFLNRMCSHADYFASREAKKAKALLDGDGAVDGSSKTLPSAPLSPSLQANKRETHPEVGGKTARSEDEATANACKRARTAQGERAVGQPALSAALAALGACRSADGSVGPIPVSRGEDLPKVTA